MAVDEVETVVVGAGVVGLALAQALAASGREVLVLEAAADIGTGISSRNSEVIHAGLYYAPGSLKARLCVEGRQRLYAWCETRTLAHRRCGKLIVATESAQRQALVGILDRARQAGVDDLVELDADQARRMEPALRCEGALHSPSTGIVDGRAYMLSLLGAAEDHGAMLARRSEVESVRCRSQGFEVRVRAESEVMRIGCRELVNSAGLGAVPLARRIEGLDPSIVPTQWFAKGSYFALSGKSPLSRLVYPVPDEAGLGIHLTLDLAGQARFGPDVEWVASPEYSVDSSRACEFEREIRRYWPGLRDGALVPAYAGVRPKVVGPGDAASDFIVSGPREHRIEGLVNLFGIESPGLTSSLALGEYVRTVLDGTASA